MELAPNLTDTVARLAATAAGTLGVQGSPQPVAPGWVPGPGASVLAATVSGGAGGQIAVAVEGSSNADVVAVLGTALEAIAADFVAALGASTVGDPITMELAAPATVAVSVSDGLQTVYVAYAVDMPVTAPGGPRDNDPLRRLNDVEMLVTAELGRANLSVREILNLVPGSVVELDRVAGGAIDLLVNGKLVARGEVVVVDEEFGVRVTEIVGDEA